MPDIANWNLLHIILIYNIIDPQFILVTYL